MYLYDLADEVRDDLERDILAHYNNVARDACLWGCTVKLHEFSRPYWKYVNLQVDDPSPLDGDRFVRDGCLMMVLYMALALVDPCGCAYNFDVEACRAALEMIDDPQPEIRTLIKTINLGFDVAARRETVIREKGSSVIFFAALGENVFWEDARQAVEHFVFGYFRAASTSFYTMSDPDTERMPGTANAQSNPEAP